MVDIYRYRTPIIHPSRLSQNNVIALTNEDTGASKVSAPSKTTKGSGAPDHPDPPPTAEVLRLGWSSDGRKDDGPFLQLERDLERCQAYTRSTLLW